MSRTTFWLLGFIVFTFTCMSCSRGEIGLEPSPNAPAAASPAPSQVDGPPADVVQASALQVDIVAGGKANASITVKIAKGYHINANPSTKFQIPTTLNVDPIYGINPGEATYPPGESKKFSFSPDPIVVYESEVVIKQPLQASADSAKGSHSLRGKLRVQPCDDSVCYPPRTLPVAIPVNVK